MTALETRHKLDDLSDELAELAQKFADNEASLAPIEREYAEFVDNYEIGLYHRSISEDGFKLPSEAMRLKLANRDMSPELYGRYTARVLTRKRIEKRMSVVKTQIDAQRSILSALKAEQEATG